MITKSLVRVNDLVIIPSSTDEDLYCEDTRKIDANMRRESNMMGTNEAEAIGRFLV